LLLLAGLLVTACGGAAPAETGGPMQSIGEGEGDVSIVAWAGYIERGDTDPAFDWVTDFEADTGCKVSVKVAATSDEMVALMNEGGFDLVTASGDASLRLISGGRVQEINTDLIPSWNTVDERLQNAPWHTVDGKHYGVPYQWGSNVLMYNTEAFGDSPPTSWNVVFEEMNLPDGQSNKGRVQAFDGPEGTGQECQTAYVDIWYDSSSENEVEGIIAEDTTWDASSGPWHVVGNVSIPEGITLTVLPGTTVFFDPFLHVADEQVLGWISAIEKGS